MARSLLVSCEAVSKAYGARSLFEELSLGLFEGDQVGLVGPNGSGKSTLLKILDAETMAEACQDATDDPAIASDPDALQARYAALEAARAEVARLYARWAELEAKQA